MSNTASVKKLRQNLKIKNTEVWKGYGYIEIIDHVTGKRIQAKIVQETKLPETDNSFEWSDCTFRMNGYKRMKTVEGALKEEDE